ncbi:MAG: CoA transferase [Pseudomonadales bacterium]|nr:CoA transferase [Pseudomonadales bacterium]
MSYEKPYQGLRVIDMTHAVAGPYCASMLARLGADVIKVEPEGGDLSRTLGKVYGKDQTVLSFLVNLGKRSICVDLKTDGGREIMQKLLASADVFIESFRPGVSKRLGFSYEDVKKINPKIIYLSVSGFGQHGPFAERPGTDGVMQAFSGFMSGNKGFDGLPHRISVIVIDLFAALYNLQSIQAALWARLNEPVGRYIDNSLLETAAAFLNINLATQITEGENNKALSYPMGIYECTDGHVMVGVLFDREFKPFMEALGLGSLCDLPDMETADQRYRNRELIDTPIKNAMQDLSMEQACKILSDLRMLHERLNTFHDFMEHEQTQAMAALHWFEHEHIGRLPVANLPGMKRLKDDPEILHSPGLGEHTNAVLGQIGYSAQDIAKLSDAKVVNNQHSKQA